MILCLELDCHYGHSHLVFSQSFNVDVVIFRPVYDNRDATLAEGTDHHVHTGGNILPRICNPFGDKHLTFTSIDLPCHVGTQVRVSRRLSSQPEDILVTKVISVAFHTHVCYEG